MKKKFFYVSTIVAMAMCAMFISCEKKSSSSSSSDSEAVNGCKCSWSVDGEVLNSERITIDEMEEYYGASSCSKLQRLISSEAGGYYDVTCKGY